MGYRNYLGRVKKEKYDELCSLTLEQIKNLYDEEDYFDVRGIAEYKKLYELGEDCDFEMKDITKRFFKEKMPFEDDEEFFIAEPEFLLKVIDSYKDNVINYYKELPKLSDEKKEYFFRSMVTEWDRLVPYNLDISTDTIVDSWKYEYAIFELVRIYKTFDWENYLLIYSGY